MRASYKWLECETVDVFVFFVLHFLQLFGCLNGNASPLSIAAIRICKVNCYYYYYPSSSSSSLIIRESFTGYSLFIYLVPVIYWLLIIHLPCSLFQLSTGYSLFIYLVPVIYWLLIIHLPCSSYLLVTHYSFILFQLLLVTHYSFILFQLFIGYSLSDL